MVFALVLILAFAAACDKSTNVKQSFPSEMDSYRAAIDSSSMEYIRVAANKESNTELWASKLRGKPYLPKGTPYPSDVDGNALILLAQINFSEVPPIDDYPKGGLLQFFISGPDGKNHVWGMNFYQEKPFNPAHYFDSLKRQKYFKVVYYPTVTKDKSKLETKFPEFNDIVLPVDEEARLTFSKASGYVLVWDYRFEKYLGDPSQSFFSKFGKKADRVSNAYIRFSQDDALGKIGGYAYFTQSDPRIHAPDSDDWLLLFQLDSYDQDDGPNILWGDLGVGNFHIERSALRNLDFSRVAYYWDNH